MALRDALSQRNAAPADADEARCFVPQLFSTISWATAL